MRFDRLWVRACVLAGLVGLGALGTGVSVSQAAPAPAKEAKAAAKSDADLVKQAVEAFKNEDPKDSKFAQLAGGFAQRLMGTPPRRPAAGDAGDDDADQAKAAAKAAADAKKLAKQILKAKREFTTDKAFLKLLDAAAKKNAPLAARWLLQYARAWRMAGAVEDVPRHVVVGQVVLEDGKLDPVFVLVQMQVLDDGYFAGEVGDLKKPLTFRAIGYQEQNVSLEGKDSAVIALGQVKLQPIGEKDSAALKGKISADGKPDWSKVSATLRLSVPPSNTPGRNYYMPRPKWPEPVKLEVGEDGEISATGLTPSTFTLSISAEGYTDFSKSVTFKPGETLELGECKLKSTDLGFYLSKKAPEAKELEWAEDFEAAKEQAEKEKRPIMVMNTATWCGWCKVLENKVFTDPWIQQFMSPFILVKEFENKKLMAEWKVTGFPTLVFTDSSGKMMYKVVGYKPTLDFAGELANARQALEIKPTSDLQTLIDKDVIKVREVKKDKDKDKDDDES